MNALSSVNRKSTATVATGLLALGILSASASPAFAATTIGGPIDLGAADTFGVLAASEVTNTGATTVNGDVGVSPGTAITGFTGAPNGLVNGTTHSADALAIQAQTDLTAAIVDAAGLTPTTSGLGNLSGLSLTPGVYSGGELSLNSGGLLTLAGTADSIWVFQAASTLTVGSTARVLITGGASSCNVFWQIGSSATIGTGAAFVGTVMASASITANTGATIEGRLLADTAAVTLQSNVITRPTGCAPGEEPVESDGPELTSASAPGGDAGTPYSYTYTATGAPAPTFTVSAGTLPAGLSLDSATGVLSGTPTTAGTSSFTITASNGTTPDVASIQSITITPQLVTVPVDGPSAGGSGTPTGVPTAGGSGTPTGVPTADRAVRRQLAATGASTSSHSIVGAAGLLAFGALLVTSARISRRHGAR